MLARHVLASKSTAEAQGELAISEYQDRNLPDCSDNDHLRRKSLAEQEWQRPLGLAKGFFCLCAPIPCRSTPAHPVEQKASPAPERRWEKPVYAWEFGE